MTPSTRTLVTGALVLFTIVMVAVGMLFVYWPTVLTGGGYDLVVTAVTFMPGGRVRIEYEDQLSYGLRTDWKFPGPVEENATILDTVDTWAYRKGGFLRWPRQRRQMSEEYDLNPKGRSLEGGADPDAMRRRVILVPGTYHVRKDGALTLYRAKSTSGEILDGFIEVSEDRNR